MAGTLAERFEAKVDRSGDHWLWIGSANRAGYGQIFLFRTPDGKRVLEGAHRVALKLTGIDIPPGLEPDHTCKVKLCVRPDHLELVPHSVNVRRTRVTCKRGHLLEGNTVKNGRSGRICKTCKYGRKRVVWPGEEG